MILAAFRVEIQGLAVDLVVLISAEWVQRLRETLAEPIAMLTNALSKIYKSIVAVARQNIPVAGSERLGRASTRGMG